MSDIKNLHEAVHAAAETILTQLLHHCAPKLAADHLEFEVTITAKQFDGFGTAMNTEGMIEVDNWHNAWQSPEPRFRRTVMQFNPMEPAKPRKLQSTVYPEYGPGEYKKVEEPGPSAIYDVPVQLNDFEMPEWLKAIKQDWDQDNKSAPDGD